MPSCAAPLKRPGLEFGQLDAISVSMGPGSYTGLRIGVSTAKGIAYAMDKPLISCGTLESMAHGALMDPATEELASNHNSLLLCPMLDARRMEVYAAFYDMHIKAVREVSADIIDEESYRDILEDHAVCFYGSGAQKCREFLSHERAFFPEIKVPSAEHMVVPVLEKFRKKSFEDVAYFQPFYLKDFVATIPRKKLL
jgi:tRNA threonylcarbamoyladenosine biosynthesis protein TsaB